MSFTRPKASSSHSDEVTVLLSTYNGSAYLQQQLDSLYAQTHPHISILARDDGSSDATRRLLEREQSSGRLDLMDGHENRGAALSFFELLKHAAASPTSYVAFCDQDDVWRPEKLARAVSALSAIRHERAAMYCSRLEIVDADLTHLGYTPVPRKIGFGNALVENIAVGCTLVLNRKAIELLCARMPAGVPVHDWWCYLVLSCFGEIVFDREATVQYRQHGSNVFGVARGPLDKVRRNLQRFAGAGEGRRWQSGQARAFMVTFGERLPAAQRQLLTQFIGATSNVWRRMQLALSNDLWRQKRIDNLVWRLLMLINRY